MSGITEWNYGHYQGLTPKQIYEGAAGWQIFRDGCPGGEAPDQAGARVRAGRCTGARVRGRRCAIRPRTRPAPARGAPDRRITADEYDRKARELKERQTEITLRIEQHQKGEGDFRTTLESLISVASRAAELFERSKTEQKRELLAFVFSNLRPRGKKARVFLAFAL